MASLIAAPHHKHTSAEVQAAKKELEALKAQKQEVKARRLLLVAELEDEATQEEEAHNVVKLIAQIQESEGMEEFTFSQVDGEESEGDKKFVTTKKVQNASEVGPSQVFPLLNSWSHAD